MNKNRRILISVFFLASLAIGFGLKYTNIVKIDTGDELSRIGVKQTYAWTNGYNYRKTITFDEAEITGTTDLTNFPVLISLTDTSLRTVANGGRVTNASGFDIIFTDTSDTQLNHEIESYNATTGVIVMWVKIPTLSYNTDTDIYMYYGNSNISTSQENKTGVWSNGYAGVWHLGANLNDSTSNANNGTNVGATTGAAGAIGNGIQTSGTQRVTVADNVTLEPSNVTVSVWAKRNGNQNAYGKPVWYGTGVTNPYGSYGFQVNNTTYTSQCLQVGGPSSGQYSTNCPAVTISDATWYFLTGSYDGTGTHVEAYVNAAQTSMISSGFALRTTETVGMAIGGRAPDTAQGWVGYLDEVRVSNVVRTPSWVQAEYATSDPANQGVGAGKFIQSLGSEVPVSAPSITTSAASSITTTTATLNGTFNANGAGTDIYFRYGTSNVACSSLTTQVLYSGNMYGSGSQSVGISSLTPGTPYYFCSYGVSNGGTTYGSVLNFTTAASTPTITTPTETNITHNDARLGGNITAQGGSPVTARGVCISTSDTTPTIAEGATCLPHASGGTGVFYVDFIDTLNPAPARYHYSAYATNGQGTAYTATAEPNYIDTLTNLPSGATAEDPTGVNSFYVTLVGAVNPNGFSNTTGHFRVFTTNPGNCNTDDGGFSRFPYSTDINIPANSTSTNFSYTIPLSGGIFLDPNTTYYYCSYSYNSNGFTGSSNVKAFTTGDGPASPCDPPSTGNLSIPAGANCTFSGAYSGSDAGTGTTNTSSITIGTGVNMVISPGQSIARGSLTKASGSTITMSDGATIIKGGIFVHDGDGDNYLDDSAQYVGTSPPGGYIRRNLIASVFNYAWKIASSGATFDCNVGSQYAYRIVPNLITDADQDGYKTAPAASNPCVGSPSIINGRTYYKDTSNVSSWLPDGQKLSSTSDCQDDPNGTPCAPSSVSVANPSSQTQNNVTFSGTQTGGAVPAGTGFDLKWCTGGSCSPSATLTTVTSVYNHVFSANPSTIYGYAIAAKNAAGTGTYSTPTQYATTAAACTNTNLYLDADGDNRGHDGTIYRGNTKYGYTDGGSSIVITKPADIVNGELMIAVIEYDGGSGRTINSVPAGWTSIVGVNNSTDVGIQAYYKYASGEGASYTFGLSTSADGVGFITSFGNAIVSSPIDVTNTGTGTGTSQTVTSISLNSANEMLFFAVGNDDGGSNGFTGGVADYEFTTPSGMTKIVDYNVSGSDSVGAFTQWITSSGATGDRTATFRTSKGYAGIMFAIKRPAQVTDVQCLTGGPPAGWSTSQNDCDDMTSTYYQTFTGNPNDDGDSYGKVATSYASNLTGTVANDASAGSYAWATPTNATTSNNSYATVTAPPTSSGNNTNYLQATNFGFALPSTATVRGIVVTAESNNGGGSYNSMSKYKLVKGGTIQSKQYSGGTYNSTDTNDVVGGPTNMWSNSFSYSDINSSSFGVAIQANTLDASDGTARIDAVTIKVYYTDSATTPSMCSGASLRTGNINNATDCYDSNASAYPGASSYQTSHRGDGSFDYNCDGTNAQATTTISCSSPTQGYTGPYAIRGSGTCGTASHTNAINQCVTATTDITEGQCGQGDFYTKTFEDASCSTPSIGPWGYSNFVDLWQTGAVSCR